jgi:threonine dehydrogenase-like Zn-dependent dehydrogenase
VVEALVNEGILDVAAFITHRYDVDDAADAFRAMDDGMDYVKVVLRISEGDPSAGRSG